MKARILNGKFSGLYTSEYLILNAELVSDWELTDVLPQSPFETFWDGFIWLDNRSNEEKEAEIRYKIELIDREYTTKISELLRKPLEVEKCDGIAISQDVLDERNRLRNECNDKITALGVDILTYRGSNRQTITFL